MIKKIFGRRSRLIIAVLLVLTGMFAFQAVKALDELNNKLEVFIQVLELVKGSYVEKNVDNTKLVYGAVKGMLESLDDPYTRFMEPKPYKEMKTRMSGSYSGIGIYIGMKHKKITVISPISDTPASKAGLKAGDNIATIDGKQTKDMALEEAVSMIRGPKGTKVTIGILRGKETKVKEYPLTREKIIVKAVEKKYLEDNIGYIKLNTFENINAGSEMRKAIKELVAKRSPGMILDLRNNGGGLLYNAAEIASMFLKKGDIIVSTVDRDKKKEDIASTGELIWTGPLVVLINEGSASASEILAGAIKDNKVGTIIGYRSFGKASVQSVRQLPDDSAILLTVAKYLTPDGTDISKKGINPDIEVKTGKEKDLHSTDASTEESEPEIEAEGKDSDKDVQLNKAVEVIKGKIK